MLGEPVALTELKPSELSVEPIRADAMQESVIYRSIQRENTRTIALNLLRRGVAIDIIASSTSLSIEEVQQLNESPQS